MKLQKNCCRCQESFKATKSQLVCGFCYGSGDLDTSVKLLLELGEMGAEGEWDVEHQEY